MSDELDLDPCKHGEQNPAFCPICSVAPPERREIVYFTAGGQHFHISPTCRALAEGQKIVSERGGTPAILDSGYLDTVRLSRKPCKTCTT